MGQLWVSYAAAHVSVPDRGVSKGTDQEASLNVTRTSSGVKWLTIPKGKSVQGPPGSHHEPAAAQKGRVWGPGTDAALAPWVRPTRNTPLGWAHGHPVCPDSLQCGGFQALPNG